MRLIRLLFSCACIILIANNANGQTLTDEEKQIFRERIEAKVLEFQDGLESLVNDALSRNTRTEYLTNTLNLFVGKGDPYTLLEYGRKKNHSAVKMHISSINHSRTITQKVKDYLYILFDPATGHSKMRYSKIRMEFSDAVRVDNIEKVDDHYECTAYYCQKFIGYGPDGQINDDKLQWKILRLFISSNNPDIDSVEVSDKFWNVKLGDIYLIDSH